MKLRDLYSLQPLKIELEHERLKKYRLTIQAASVVPMMSGLPKSSGVTSKVESFGIKIHDTELRIREIETRISELEEFIENVRDDQIRVILKLKFEDGMTYQQIAGQLGGKNSKDSIKQILYRFFAHS